MSAIRKTALLLLLVFSSLAGACRYSGPVVESVERFELTYSAEASTAVYRGSAKLGEYRLATFEGKARAVVTGGEDFELQRERQLDGRAVTQPFSGERLTLQRLPGGRAKMRSGDQESVLRFVTGSWELLERGQDVVLRFEEESWGRWIAASQNAILELLDGYRSDVADQLERNESLTYAEVLDVLVDERPLVRANRGELLVFLEPIRIKGGFSVEARERGRSNSWWSYELQPEVGEALASVARATLAVAVISLDICARSVRYCR